MRGAGKEHILSVEEGLRQTLPNDETIVCVPFPFATFW